MKKMIAVLLALIFVFALCACGGSGAADANKSPAADDYFGSTADKQMSESNGDYGMSTGKPDSGIVSVNGAIYDDPNAKIIRTATLTIQTIDFDKSVKDLAALTEANGGYYETSNNNAGGYYDQAARRNAYFVIRIPKANYVAFRDAIGSIGHIHSFAENSKNVGEEYYDTEMRLETLHTKHDRLLALLADAKQMDDIISLENALADVEYEIDRLSTTLRKYDSLIDYSTFTVNLNEVIKISNDPNPKDGFGTRLLAQLFEGLSAFGEGVQNFVLWLARNIITLVIIAAIVFVAVKLVIKYRKKRINQ